MTNNPRAILIPGLLLLAALPGLTDGRAAAQNGARTLAVGAEVYAVAFNPDGKKLASGSYDHDAYVKVWDVATGEVVWKARGHERPVLAVAFSPDGKALATGGIDKTVRLWDAAAG